MKFLEDILEECRILCELNISNLIVKNAPNYMYSYAVYIKGRESTPVGFIHKSVHGYQIFDDNGHGQGNYQTLPLAQQGVLDRVLGHAPHKQVPASSLIARR